MIGVVVLMPILFAYQEHTPFPSHPRLHTLGPNVHDRTRQDRFLAGVLTHHGPGGEPVSLAKRI